MALSKYETYKLLKHAAWHCRWASDTEDRPATRADLDAAELLEAKALEVLRGWKSAHK